MGQRWWYSAAAAVGAAKSVPETRGEGNLGKAHAASLGCFTGMLLTRYFHGDEHRYYCCAVIRAYSHFSVSTALDLCSSSFNFGENLRVLRGYPCLSRSTPSPSGYWCTSSILQRSPGSLLQNKLKSQPTRAGFNFPFPEPGWSPCWVEFVSCHSTDGLEG